MLGLQRLFFGNLRPIEIEQLYEKAWFAITETCLAMTIFREEVGAYFLVMFVSLLIGKVWGWIGEGRVEILDQQPPANPGLFHLRLSLSLVISALFDMYMLVYSVQTVLQQARPNMMVVFAFEFAVLQVLSLSTVSRYCISLYEASVIKSQTKSRRDQIRRERVQARQRAAASGNAEPATGSNQTTAGEDENVEDIDIDVPGWEEKGRWIFYLDLLTGNYHPVCLHVWFADCTLLDFLKLVLYLTFFFVLCVFYGMPIHIIRDVALTIRSFYKRINDFVRYRQATRDMNSRYPDATPEEIAREDVCIICREDMRAGRQGAQENPEATAQRQAPTVVDERLRPKKLPCGHILHFACLRSWLERQQNCPTCRRPVLVPGGAASSTTVAPRNQNIGAVPPGQQQPANLGHGAGHQPAIAHNVFNLGPFRLAFGARIGGQAFPPQANNNPAFPNQQVQGGNNQGINNGFGLFRQSRERTMANFPPLNVQAQLHQIELQILREAQALRLQADQLYLVRSLQGELARLRIQQSQANQLAGGNPSPNPSQQGPPNVAVQGLQAFQNAQAPFIPQVFTNNHQQQPLGSGHPDLPPGMVLPEGWSILPLQRIAQDNPPINSEGNDVNFAQSDSVSQSAQNSTQLQGAANETNLSLNNLHIQPTAIPAAQSSTQITTSSAPELGQHAVETPIPQSLPNGSDGGAGSEPPSTRSSNQPPQDPTPSSIPNWGSAPVLHNGPAANPESSKADTTHGSMNGIARSPGDTVEPEALAAERRKAKGKGRAVTIEDEIEDVD
ncbi:MAG: hypothetical protein Q9191_006258 [Dirinaria sp. TL-2023a]